MQAAPIPYPVLYEGDEIHHRHYTLDFNQQPIYISAKAENPVEIIEWIDWMYSPEGVQECAWGVEGSGYESELVGNDQSTFYYDEDGNRQFSSFVNETPNSLTPDQVYRHFLMRDCIVVWDWENQSLMYQDPKFQEAWDVWGGVLISTMICHKL